MAAYSWSDDLVEIRHTHVSDNKWPLNTNHPSIQHAKYVFLVYLGQGNALGLDVESLKLNVVSEMQYSRDR